MTNGPVEAAFPVYGDLHTDQGPLTRAHRKLTNLRWS